VLASRACGTCDAQPLTSLYAVIAIQFARAHRRPKSGAPLRVSSLHRFAGKWIVRSTRTSPRQRRCLFWHVLPLPAAADLKLCRTRSRPRAARPTRRSRSRGPDQRHAQGHVLAVALRNRVHGTCESDLGAARLPQLTPQPPCTATISPLAADLARQAEMAVNSDYFAWQNLANETAQRFAMNTRDAQRAGRVRQQGAGFMTIPFARGSSFGYSLPPDLGCLLALRPPRRSSRAMAHACSSQERRRFVFMASKAAS